MVWYRYRSLSNAVECIFEDYYWICCDSQNVFITYWLLCFCFYQGKLSWVTGGKNGIFGSTEELCDFYISSDIVETKLKGLKQNKSAGVGGIGSKTCKMLIELADVIAEIVSCLFRKSLSNGDIPDDWKSANVTAIF